MFTTQHNENPLSSKVCAVDTGFHGKVIRNEGELNDLSNSMRFLGLRCGLHDVLLEQEPSTQTVLPAGGADERYYYLFGAAQVHEVYRECLAAAMEFRRWSIINNDDKMCFDCFRRKMHDGEDWKIGFLCQAVGVRPGRQICCSFLEPAGS